MHRLFQTYELVGNILLALDHPSLRAARLVSKFWHTVIAENKTLHTTWTQRYRLRIIRIVLVGASNVGKRTLIASWCHTARTAWKNDQSYRDAVLRLPDSGGETWLANIRSFDGETGLDLLTTRLPHKSDFAPHGFVLVYELDRRDSFDEVRRWWQKGKLSFSGGDETQITTVQQADTLEVRQADARKKRAELDEVERSGKPITVQRIAGCCPLELENDKRQWALSSRPAPSDKPALLALVATKSDLPPERRDVLTSDGEALAREMGVPFYEVSTKAAGTEGSGGMDAELPLRGFWRTFRDAILKEKAERQRREREARVKTFASINQPQRRLSALIDYAGDLGLLRYFSR